MMRIPYLENFGLGFRPNSLKTLAVIAPDAPDQKNACAKEGELTIHDYHITSGSFRAHTSQLAKKLPERCN